MARSFSYSRNSEYVVTPRYGATETGGYIRFTGASFNESNGNITISYEYGVHSNSNGSCGLIAAVCVYLDGYYDSGKNSGSNTTTAFGRSVYIDQYMIHGQNTVTSQQGSSCFYSNNLGAGYYKVSGGSVTVSKRNSLAYGAKAQMGQGWGWSNRWDVTSYPAHINTGGSVSFTFPQYDVSYDANGGSSTPSTQTFDWGGSVKVASAISRTGHTFAGWKASNGTNYAAGNTYSASASTKMTAQWTANKYTITYNANGGSGAPDAHSYTYASTGTTNLSSKVPTRTGYTFLGWSLSSTATSKSYDAGQAWNLNNASNYTLYAVWQINKYYLDVNGWLDGSSSGGLSPYGTVDVTVAGTKVGENVSDYYTQHNYNSSYSISDIKANSGYQYNGVYSGSLSGTIGAGNVSVVLNFSTIKPSNLSISGTVTGPFNIDLSWSASGLNISNYKVYANNTVIYDGTGTSCSFSAAEETVYNIYFTATNPGGTTTSATIVRETPADQAKIRRYNKGAVPTIGQSLAGTTVNFTPEFLNDYEFFRGGLLREDPLGGGSSGGSSGIIGGIQGGTSSTSSDLIKAENASIWATETSNGSGYRTITLYITDNGSTHNVIIAEQYGRDGKLTDPDNLEIRTTSYTFSDGAGKLTYITDEEKFNQLTAGQWQKGKTYFKKDGKWVKAKKIYRKVDGVWKIGTNYDN